MNDEVFQPSLFQDCSTKCEAYGACGGFRHTAPCGCAWSPQSSLYHQCHNCYLLCREIGKFFPDDSLLVRDFETEFANGLTLDQVSIIQERYAFPRYIPVYASTHHGNAELSDWVAVDANMLFNFPTPTSAHLKPIFSSAANVRQHLHVTLDCKLVAILNGFDWKLEKFWAARRVAILKQLVSIGFSACTAPTFSVTELTTEGTPVPYSHHTAMLMRHHKVMEEIDQVGLCSIPNLYWIDKDKREITRWAEWLRKNPEIHTVSRDFSSTKYWSAIEPKLLELIELLSLAGRSFQVLVVGTGFANAVLVTRKLLQAGHEVTIVTADPFHSGVHGKKYTVDETG